MRYIIAAIVCILLSVPAAAQLNLEVGVGAGPSLIRDTDNGATFQDNSFGFQIEVGVSFNDRFAISLGYLNLGEGSDTFAGVPTDIAVDAATLGFRWTFNPESRIEAYSRLGLTNYYSDVDPGGGFELFGATAIDFGVGAAIPVGDSGRWFAEIRYLDGSDQEEGGVGLIGYRHRF
ncbi:MAG: outer membrane beta-barrel protein [Pseudomonadota bacterium]